MLSVSADRVPDLIKRAVESLIAADREAACAAISEIDVSGLVDDRARKLSIARSAPPILDRVTAPRRRSISKSVKDAVFQADSYLCQICGRKTIALPVLKRVSAAIPDELPYHKNWKFGVGHLVYWTHSTSLDHVIPLARRGADDVSNFCTSCYGCNDARGDRTLEEMGWSVRPRRESSWRGLTEYLKNLVPAPTSTGRGRGVVTHRIVEAQQVPAGAFVLIAMPDRTQRRAHRIEAIDADGRWSVRELWRSHGVWVSSQRLQVIEPPTTVALLATVAPRDGDA